MVFQKQLCIVLFGTCLFYIIRLLECRKIEGYAFPVFSTKECPRNQAEWNNRSSAINCTESNGYMCLPNENLTDLLEFCYIYPRILVQKDLCLYLTKRFSRVNSHNCLRFTHGCPDLNYFSDETYIHTSCSEIENGCFSAEPNCKRQPVQGEDNPNIGTTVATILGVSIPSFFLCIMLCYFIRKRNARQQSDIENPEEEPLIDNETEIYQESSIEKAMFDQWKVDDSYFISTKACEKVQKSINSRNLVIVAGHSGSGKSAIIQHIALKYREQGWTVKMVKKVEDIVDACSSNRYKKNKTIFVFNDPLGKESLDEILNNSWQTFEEELKLHLKTAKLLMSCRNHILSDPRLPRYLVYQSDIIEIDNEMYKLSLEEKRQILTKYTSGMKLSDKDCDEIIQIEKCFPLLCRLYSRNDAYKSRGIGFFKEPVTVMEKIISEFRKNDKGKFCALALLVLFNDDLCVSELLKYKDTENKFKYTLQLCGLPENTPLSAIEDNLNSPKNFFVKNVGGTYHFYHDFVMEITTHVFGTDCTVETIKYADISLHRRKLRMGYSEEPSDLFILYLNLGYKEEFGKRIFNELFGDRLMDVVLNPCLDNQMVFEALTELIKKHSDNIPKLLEKKELEFNKRKYHTKKTLQMSKLDFIGFQKYITPLFVLIVCSHTDISLVCLDILQRMHANLISSSLLSAVYCNGSMKLFQSFLKDQVNESLTTEWGGLYPVHILSAFHNYEILEELIKIVDNIHSQLSIWDSWTPLLLAAGNDIQKNGDYHHEESGATRRDKTIKLLLEKGADINLCDENGRSPLYVASENGHDSTVQLLLEKGADIKLCTKDNKFSPLYVASENGHESTVKLLLEKGADVNYCMKDKLSPLYVACANGHESTVELLLEKGADVNYCTKDKLSPLYVACENGHESTVKLLLEKGADVNFCRKDNKPSPLYVASANGHESTVKLLLEIGADFKLYTKDNKSSPLYVASENGHDSIVQLLLEIGADVNFCTKDESSPLYEASKNGHNSTVQLLLEKGANVNLCTKDKSSPLYVASKNGHNSIVQLLLEKGANVNFCTKDESSPLYEASKNGHNSTVQLLLEKGANVNLCTKDKSSPLYVASKNGHDSIVQLLLEKGANVNFCTKDESSPLYEASKNGHNSTVQLLLEKGANVNLCTKDKSSPLYVASKNGHNSIVQLLLEKGENVNFCTKDESSPLYEASKNGHNSTVQLLLEKGANVNLCTKDIFSPLYVACENGHDSIVEILVSNEAEINLCSNKKGSPLYVASENGHNSIVQLLLEKGANVNLCTKDKSSPLYVASKNGHNSIAQLLLEKGANVNFCTKDESSPLYEASKNGHNSIVQLLLEKGANVNLCTKDIFSPLYVACENGHGSIVEILVSNEAEINLCSNKKGSPLYVASENGHNSIVQLLLEKGANVNLCTKDKSSPLYVASKNGHNSIVQLLLEKGANVNLCAKDGSSPLYVACENRHFSIVELLVSKKADVNLCANDGASPL